jgi:hypothetical protein
VLYRAQQAATAHDYLQLNMMNSLHYRHFNWPVFSNKAPGTPVMTQSSDVKHYRRGEGRKQDHTCPAYSTLTSTLKGNANSEWFVHFHTAELKPVNA